MPDLELLFTLLSAFDPRQLNLLRFYELQIEFLLSRVSGRLIASDHEKAAFARLVVEIGRPDLLCSFTPKPSSAGTAN